VIFGRMRDMIRALKARWQLSRRLEPREFLSMAEEIQTMARSAARACPPHTELQSAIQRIHDDAEALARRAVAPDFRRLPLQERMILRQGLVQSRRQLLQSMQCVPSPTRLLQ